jgi:lysophospholipase L1-like esterase
MHFSQNIPGLKSEVRYDRNRFGLRSLSMNMPEKADNVVRILCLGASTTEQTTQSTEDMWCSLLEQHLNREYRDREITFEAAAFGRGGVRATDNAVWLARMFDIVQPDIVVTLLGINDLSLNGGPGYVARNIDGELAQPGDSLLVRCQEISQLCRRSVSTMKRIKQAYQLSKGSVVEWHSDNLPARRSYYQSLPFMHRIEREPDPLVEFADSVRWILDFLRKRDVAAIVLGQPVIWNSDLSDSESASLWFPIFTPDGPVRADPAWLATEMERYNSTQKTLAHDYGAPYVDLNSMIPKSSEYFFDDCHFTDKGSALMAKKVAPALRTTIDTLSGS